MNKIYFLLILFIGQVSVLEAQKEIDKRFTMGFIGGMTLAQIDGDNLQGYHKAGFMLGLRSVASITERFSFSTDLIYNQRGSQTKDFRKTLLKRRQLQTNFAEISFQLNYKEWYSPFNEMYKLQIFAGASIGRLLKTKTFDNVEQELNLFELAKEFNSKDFALMAGVNYYFTDQIAMGFRFARSLTLLFEAQESSLIEYNPKNYQGYYISFYTFYLLP